MNQETKAKMVPAIKAVLKKYNLKGSISVRNHSSLNVTIKSGAINFTENKPDGHIQVNQFYLSSNYEGIALTALTELNDAMNVGNFDDSDSQRDYFHVGWYTRINIGAWDKPYQLIEA